jgi:hypothetical protein
MGFEFIQTFGTISGLTVTFVVNKMKNHELKLNPLTVQGQKIWMFPEFSS